MLQFNQVSLRRGSRLLFADVSFRIDAGQRVGLTGANGSGKTSLLALVRGELSVDSGRIDVPANWRLGYVAQETDASDEAALAFVLAGDVAREALQQRLALAEARHDGAEIARVHDELHAIDAYSAPARAAAMLAGLGFTHAEMQGPVAQFSGGWRMRLNLARTLMCRADLLLLDEPTNHLDLDAVIWLQEWLRGFSGTLLLISHDREFLDAVVERTLHVADGTVRMYSGNYSAFECAYAEHLAQSQALHAKQSRQAEHMRAFVERFRAKASKARQAQSRLKALARLQTSAPAHVDTPFSFSFKTTDTLPYPLLRVERATVAYGDRTILADVNLSIAPGDRLGLLGRNGAGKSTLVKLLGGAVSPSAGTRSPARDLRIGYFAQHQLEQLRGDETALAHMRRADATAAEQDLRTHLGSFGFGAERALAPVATFSGGEKARLVLALICHARPQLLLLDEPTNHLDLEMRHALTLALQDFAGALVLVAHDRHLLRNVCDDFLLVADGAVVPFAGDLDDYGEWLTASRRAATADGDTARTTAKAAQKSQRALVQSQRKEAQRLEREIARLETTLAELAARQADIDTRLADAALYTQPPTAALAELTAERARIIAAQEETEARWLAQAAALEALGAAADT